MYPSNFDIRLFSFLYRNLKFRLSHLLKMTLAFLCGSWNSFQTNVESPKKFFTEDL
jgi:hypothetical protein